MQHRNVLIITKIKRIVKNEKWEGKSERENEHERNNGKIFIPI